MDDRRPPASLFLTPSDVALLRAVHIAPRPLWRVELRYAKPFLIALPSVPAAVMAASVNHRLGTAWAAALGALAAALVIGAYVWRRLAWPQRSLLGRVDAQRLERLLLAEAMLANERAGLLVLTEAPAGLHAGPTVAPIPWPDESLEAMLIRRRPMRVAQLVADWRGGAGDPLGAIARAAVQRGVLHESGARYGAALVATSAAQAVLSGDPPRLLAEACRTDRPSLWRGLMAAIEEGLLLAPATAPVPPSAPDPREHAGVDRYGVPSGQAPGQALTTAMLVGAAVILAAIVLARLGGAGLNFAPSIGHWAWPLGFGITSAVWLFAAARPPWPDDPLPPHGDPREETALAHRRRRRLARPRTRHPWPVRLFAAAVMGGLVYVLTLFVTPIGIAVLALVVVAVSWRGSEWYRLQQLMPSAREVQLAVTRRSRELSAGRGATATESSISVENSGTERRARQWHSPAGLPPPRPAAVALTDRRRRLAAAAIRRHGVALLLFAAGLGAIAYRLAPAGLLESPLVLLGCAGLLYLLARALVRLLRAIHLTQSQAWQVAPGAMARLLRCLASVLPRSGVGRLPGAVRTLRRCLAEEPEFWRDKTLDLAAPLGRAPYILTAAAAVIFLLSLTAGVLGRVPDLRIAGAAGLGLAGIYAWFLWQPMTPVPSQPAPRLVLLRVFGSPSFDDLLELVRPWLLCGPVTQLEGYDSIGQSIEAREALAAGHVDGVLVNSPDDLANRLAMPPAPPDDNGRYRREAFQCTGVAWRGAVRVLLDRGSAVLMDLSGLGPTNRGCAFELGLLLDRMPLSRVLLLVGESTDLACLDQILDEAEQRIAADSPNLGDPTATWRLLRIGGLSARGASEGHDAWLRRLDQRLAPLPLVHFMLAEIAAVPGDPVGPERSIRGERMEA
jgi:hypothetical protein